MNQFEDLMCDTEALGLPPTGALVSIGARFFDLKTETLGPSFQRTIHLASSVAHGGTIDAGTCLFWLRQSDEARKGIAYNGEPIDLVLQDFSNWIKQTCRHEDVRVWANSPAFDCVIVGGAYDRLGMPRPWHFSKERDFRTARALYPMVEYNVEEKGDGAHTALADADFQIAHLLKIKRSRRRG